MQIGEHPPTLSSLLLRAIRRHGERVALQSGAESLTYAQLDQKSASLANFLRNRGAGKGTRIALLLYNSIEYAIADIAILKLGAVKTPLNEYMSPTELSFCLRHSGASVLISDVGLSKPEDLDGAIAKQLRTRIAVGTPLTETEVVPWDATVNAIVSFENQITNHDDPTLIMYTGGTTGRPKGIVHLQGRLGSCMLAHVVCGEVACDEVMLLGTSLAHSAGFFLQTCLLVGGRVVLVPKFDAGEFLRIAIEVGATWTFAVPTMLYRLIDAVKSGASPPHLRTVIYGAAPISRERLTEALAIFGPVFIQLYGQSESPNFITSLTKSEHLDFDLLGSCGSATPFAEVTVRDTDGEEVVEGTVGEVWVQSSYMLAEYLDDPATSRATLQHGWLHTGDLGYLDRAGHLFLVDRAKDMIISGGFNVYSVEVESALRQHEAVLDVAVVGLPDSDWGERVVAAIVPKGPINVDELRRFGRNALSAYKAPKEIVLVEALPVTAYGKIDKKALRLRLNAGGNA